MYYYYYYYYYCYYYYYYYYSLYDHSDHYTTLSQKDIKLFNFKKYRSIFIFFRWHM